MTDYKKYSLGQLENFLHDAMNTDATAQEIYHVIKSVVEDNYLTYTKSANQAKDLLDLLYGRRPVDWNLSDNVGKVKKWIIPIEESMDGESYIDLPYDLLQEAKLKEGDQIEWIPRNDNSYIMKKFEVKN
jgi:hypothetical protein